MADSHVLDRPVWNALRSGWSALAEGDGRALRLRPDHGPFGASADATAESREALRTLIPAGGELWIVEAGEAALPCRAAVARTGLLAQMVAERIAPAGRSIEAEIVPLGDADAAEMYALAHLTKPGPYASHTHRLGGFVGIRQEGRLVAMAGERMRVDRFAEVSGVCAHPDWRGRGYAGALMRVVMQAMLDRGETPFLHSYAHNSGAIALYEGLGFRTRAEIGLTILSG